MAVKIRLKRLGKIRAPFYRIVVADSHVKRIMVNSERVQYWLSVGAQPTEPVAAILRATGDWQQFKGLPAPAPLQTLPERPSKRAKYDEALATAHGTFGSAPAAPKTEAKAESGKDTAGDAPAEQG